MKTVLVSGNASVPAELRELVERGSTSIVEHRAAELVEAPVIDADRIVFWSPSEDAAIRTVAERYARREAVERREAIVFVTAGQGGAPSSVRLSPHELFVWPGDEDRLKMAFLTGA